jgi:UDP-N-acetylmuramoyl-tripeptide--D-alanyl-D-alanine ligase
VTTDSRAITPGCIFFAFKGEHFDGNAFAPQALEQGAALCVISDSQYAVDDRCIVVPDVLATLQELAREHRRHLTIPIVGITGTNGKTTTKELVHAVLAKRYRTSATKGNFNNHLGVPLTLLAIPADAELAIVEMGANHPGEIAFLCGIADPDCGLITNVGRAHLEGFGSFEGVVKTKTELYRHLRAKQGLVFVNADNERLMEEAKGMKTLTYGRTADVRGTLVDCDPYLHFYFEQGDNVYNVHSHLLGAYNFDNAMAAVAVGLHFGVEPFDIKEAIEEYLPSNNRSQFKRTDRNTLYLDCYNANPSSMAVAIESFGLLQADHKVATIGGMHELGADERKEHEQLVAELEAIHPEQCLLVGPEFDGIALPPYMLRFDDTDALKAHLQANPISGATVLVKGSNTNRLWTLEEVL